MKMQFHSLEINIENNWYPVENGKTPFFPDVNVTLENSVLTLTANETPVSALRVHWENIVPAEADVLGDMWERGYGDLHWKKRSETGVLPWYFLAAWNGDVSAFGVKTQPNAMCWWACDDTGVTLTADTTSGRKGVRLLGRTLPLAEIVFAEYTGDTFDAAVSFCKVMCPSPRLPAQPVYGGNDWYCNYGENSYESIVEHTRKIVGCAKENKNRPFMVIDDGWQLCHHNGTNDAEYFNGGPWRYCSRRFGDMKKLAEEITAMGAKPGIWFRPLWTTEELPKEYILKYEATKYTLDPSVPAVLEMIKEDVATIRSWGYKLIKHDFTSYDIFAKWGMDPDHYLGMPVDFADDTRTTAEIVLALYRAIREAAGDDILIIGCNTFSHLSAGLFELQRTGDDTSGREWERTRKMGVNTLAFRAPHHGTFYAADADCVGITGLVDWQKNNQWLDVLAKSGTPLFVSIADNGCFTKEVEDAVTAAFQKACEPHAVSRPLDWMTTKTPAVWKSDFGTDTYQWND